MGELLFQYPSEKRNAEIVAMAYWKHLSGYSRDRLTGAVNRSIGNSKFFPTIAIILENMPSRVENYVPMLPPPELGQEEMRFRQMYLAYAGVSIRRKEKPTLEGLRNFIGSMYYKNSRKNYPQGDEALRIIDKYSKPEHWQ